MAFAGRLIGALCLTRTEHCPSLQMNPYGPRPWWSKDAFASAVSISQLCFGGSSDFQETFLTRQGFHLGTWRVPCIPKNIRRAPAL